MEAEKILAEHDRRISAVEKCQIELTASVNKVVGESGLSMALIKKVVLPLIIIVGALVGLDIGLQ